LNATYGGDGRQFSLAAVIQDAPNAESGRLCSGQLPGRDACRFSGSGRAWPLTPTDRGPGISGDASVLQRVLPQPAAAS